MKATLGQLRRLIKEALETNRVGVGPVMGSPEKGFNIRLTKEWHMLDNERAWFRLRRALVKHGMDAEHEAWAGSGDAYGTSASGVDNFIILDLRGRDIDSAELERQKLIGDIEASGFEVDEGPAPEKRSPHPYR